MSWLKDHEGEIFFCYTNRKNSIKEIEQYILPKLDSSIHIVFLEGKKPKSELDNRFVSHSLYRLENVGFPNVMRVVNGKMQDYSLHNPVYSAINQSRLSELGNITKQAINNLKSNEKRT